MSDIDLKNLLEENSYLKKFIKLHEDPAKHVPERLKDIKKVLDIHFKEENELNNVIIKQIQDKYKNELNKFEYTKNTHILLGKQIIYISRRTHKISKIMDVIDYKKDEFDKIIGILVKSKRARVLKFVSFLKNYIFEYVGNKNNDLEDLLNIV